MQGPFRTYLTVFLLLIGLGFGGLAVLQLLVDPVGAHPWFALESIERYRFRQGRVAKAEALRRMQPRTLILGTSRSVNGIDAASPLFPAPPVYNAGLDATNFAETERIYAYAIREVPGLEQILIETSLHMFGANQSVRPAFKESLFWEEISLIDYQLTLLFGESALRRTSGVLSYALTSRTRRSYVRPDGTRVYFKKPKSHRRLFEGQFRANYLVKTYNGMTLDPARLEGLKRVVRDAHARGIRVDLILPPIHVTQREVMVLMGVDELYTALRRRLTSLVAEVQASGGAPVHLWEFAGVHPYTTETITDDPDHPMRWYMESSHFTLELGELVLARVYGQEDRCAVPCDDFGRRLTPDSLPRLEAEERAARQRWRERHPDLVQWLQELYDDTAERRALALARFRLRLPSSSP